MKFLKFNVFILLFTSILLCIPSFLFARAEERIEEAHPLDRDGKVYLENISGNIVVKSWEKNEVKILARKVAKNEESLDKISFDVNQTNNNIRIKTRYKKTWGLFKSVNASVHYDLLIPDKAQLRVKSVSGSVEALNIGGSVDIETVSGRIELVEAGKGAKCKSISGSVYVEEITGNAVLNSTSGKVHAESVKGSVEAHSVSGSIVLREISLAEEIKAESISGSIKMLGELSPGGNYEFKTISGGIRLDLPSKSDFELEANTMSGTVRCNFELKVSGKISRKKIQGVAGKGGSSLKISSLSGGITIN
ncbi:DUF4097 domain-containing protein [Thermodesulfobacteriota bacterium]